MSTERSRSASKNVNTRKATLLPWIWRRNVRASRSRWRIMRSEHSCRRHEQNMITRQWLYDRRHVDEIPFSISAPAFLQLPFCVRALHLRVSTYYFSHLTRFQNDCLDGKSPLLSSCLGLSPLQPSTPPIADQLTDYGYSARAISLPSVGPRTGLPGATLPEDAGNIQSVMSKSLTRVRTSCT